MSLLGRASPSPVLLHLFDSELNMSCHATLSSLTHIVDGMERSLIDLILTVMSPEVMTGMFVIDCNNFTIRARNTGKQQLMFTTTRMITKNTGAKIPTIHATREFPLNMLATTSKI